MAVVDMEVPQWTFGERLEKARKKAHLSREEVAEHFSTSTKNVWNWEHDVRPRDLDLGKFAQEWARLTKVPATWLLGLDSDSGYTQDLLNSDTAPTDETHRYAHVA